MTYAAGLEAVTIVWIAARFTDEHRAALDWLNRITEESIRFFGIEIEAYRIGGSMPAPYFQLVSKPNEWSKTTKTNRDKSVLTESQAFYMEYFSKMKEFFDNSNTKLKHQKPYPQHWTSFASGKSNFIFSAVASYRDNYQRVEFFINGNDAKQIFDILKNKYETQSLNEIDKNLIWNRMEDRIASCISLIRNVNISDRSDWENQFNWFMDKLEKFDTFFRPKIKDL
jgi:hypothetical protein